MSARPSIFMRARHFMAWILAGPQEARLRKARSRVRLAMLGFGVLYSIIAVSLVLYVVRYD
ncbi:MAG: hypothetical protein Q8S29_02535, partial [Phreatobacter sp.]|nr:hypothetical protein [Phreatobacter sp.]